MGTRVYSYTFTGSEPAGAVFFTAPFPAFTGSFVTSVTLDGPAGGIINFLKGFRRTGDSTQCWTDQNTILSAGTSTGDTNTVGSPGFDWHCYDWNQFTFGYNSATDRLGALRHVTIELTGAFPDLEFCEYGTQFTGVGDAIIQITPDVILSRILPPASRWMAPYLGWQSGRFIDANALCGSGPPPIEDFDFTNIWKLNAQVTRVFDNLAWHALCECAPAPVGSPEPIPYDDPVIVQPPGIGTPVPFGCSNADICEALRKIERLLNALNGTATKNLGLTTLLQRYNLPFAYVAGAAHSGLSGSGSFAISRLIGVQVDITSPLPGRQLEGTPPYIWDLGWMSIMTPEGMIEERRITRDTQVWQPQLIQEATTFGYFFKEGVGARVTELQAEAADASGEIWRLTP